MPTINGTMYSDTLAGTTGNDVMYGYDGADILFGDAGNDTLYGGNGTDVLEGYTGNDYLDGGADFDFATYILSSSGVTVNLSITGPQNTGGAGTDTLVNIEGLFGSDYNDTLTGNGGDNIIDAGAGVDQVYGGDGTDILNITYATDFAAGEVYDGGAGYDGLLVAGGVNLSLATIRNIEEIDSTGQLSAAPSQINGLSHLSTGTLTLTSAGTARLAGCELGTYAFVLGTGGIVLDLDGSIGGGHSVAGSSGVDVITGGSGDDVLNGNGGDDVLYGGNGIDNLDGGAGNDALHGGAGNDWLSGGAGDDVLYGDAGNDVLVGSDGSDTMYGGEGQDVLRIEGAGAATSHVQAYGGDDNDQLIGGGAGNTLYGDGGNDYVVGSGGITAHGGSGNDDMHASGAVLYGDDGTDTLTGDSGSNILDGGAGNDRIQGGKGDDTLYGGDGDDWLRGNYDDYNEAGLNKLYGGAGNDTLYVSRYDTVLDGGDGNDVFMLPYYSSLQSGLHISGGAGTDRLVFASPLDFTNVTVDGIEEFYSDNQTELTFSAASLNGASYIKADRLKITTAGTANIVNGKVETNAITLSVAGITLNMAGSTGWTNVQGSSGTDVVTLGDSGMSVSGFAGDDTLTGGAGVDYIDGGAGLDLINGGGGDDVLTVAQGDLQAGETYNGGAGNDTLKIFYSGADLSGITLTNIEKLEVSGTVRVAPAQLNGIVSFIGGAITFTTNGTADLSSLTTPLSLNLAAGDNAITLPNAATTVTGNTGADILHGGAQGDALHGGAGADTIYGGDGNDTLWGDAGIDTLYGGAGNDVLNFSADADLLDGGDGDDWFLVSDLSQLSSGTQLVGGAGTDWLVIDPQTADLTGYAISGVEGVWSTRYASSITMSGTQLTALQAGHFGGLVISTSGHLDLSALNLTANTITLGNGGNDLVLSTDPNRTSIGTVTGGSGNDTITGGYSQNQIAIYGGGGNDTLNAGSRAALLGGDGNDRLTGSDASDLLDGGAGDDYLDGGAGSDYVLFTNAGSNDLTVDLAAGTATGASIGSDTLVSIECATTSGGNDTLSGTDDANVLNAGAGNNLIYGKGGDDRLDSGGGNDTVYGGSGNDTISDGGGTNLIAGEDGDDVITDFGSHSTITGGSGNDTISCYDGTGSVVDGGDGNDEIFGNNNSTITGGNGDDFIKGNTANSTVDGGAGNDKIYLRAPDNSAVTLTLTPGAALSLNGSTYSNFEYFELATYNGDDTISFVAPLYDTRLHGNLWDGGQGTDTAIVDLSGSTSVLAMAPEPSLPFSPVIVRQDGNNLLEFRYVEKFDVRAGSGNDSLQGSTGSDTLSGGGGDDGLQGGDGDDTLLGDAGNDILNGGAGSDMLNGGVGNDTLLGGDEHDTLTGGAGDDALDGGSNIDTAVFAGNQGAYVVNQTSTGIWQVSGPDGTDTLTNVEYAKFDDQTMRLLPGTGATIDWSASPATYMAGIRDFDGGDVSFAEAWKLIGTADVNGDTVIEHVLVNRQNGRWAEVATAPDGKSYFDDHGWAGGTRVVGIYIDPLIALGIVQAGSDVDSQRRFQHDLFIENINGILGQNDYNHDGLQEIYFSLTDGTAYLHAYMHADGNIQYANYQSKQQVIDYLTTNGWDSGTWSGWFPSSQTPLLAGAGG